MKTDICGGAGKIGGVRTRLAVGARIQTRGLTVVRVLNSSLRLRLEPSCLVRADCLILNPTIFRIAKSRRVDLNQTLLKVITSFSNREDLI